MYSFPLIDQHRIWFVRRDIVVCISNRLVEWSRFLAKVNVMDVEIEEFQLVSNRSNRRDSNYYRNHCRTNNVNRCTTIDIDRRNLVVETWIKRRILFSNRSQCERLLRWTSCCIASLFCCCSCVRCWMTTRVKNPTDWTFDRWIFTVSSFAFQTRRLNAQFSFNFRERKKKQANILTSGLTTGASLVTG